MNVTVALTYYENDDFLKAALNSIKSQTIQPYEVIFVDDGSKSPPRLDELLSICDTVVYAPHHGVGASLNTVIRLMSGDILCWLPADDFWAKDKLEKQAQFAKQNPGCVLHSYSQLFREDCFLDSPLIPDLSDEEMKIAIRVSSPYYANTLWIPKPILDLVGPFLEGTISEDYQWILRSIIQYRVRYRLQKEVLTFKRLHSGSNSVRLAELVSDVVQRFNKEIR